MSSGDQASGAHQVRIDALDGSAPIFVGPETVATLGRGENCLLRMTNPVVSREHAVVQFHEGVWWFTDCSSSGTFGIDGEYVAQVALSDVPLRLRLGSTTGPTVELTVQLTSTAVPTSDWAESAPLASSGTENCHRVNAAEVANRSVLIGRGADCDVVLGSLLASRHHARLTGRADGWKIEDLGSANGTRVNGRLVTEAVLNDGDGVTMGGSAFRFAAGQLRPLLDDGVSGFEAVSMSVEVSGGHLILSDVTVTAGTGTFTGIVGPSGAGKSTLLKALTGVNPPTSGRVLILGMDLYQNYEALLPQLGYVPQDDIVHGQLTVQEALDFGSSLRFPENTNRDERLARVDQVLGSLGLMEHRTKRIAQLSGGQRKRVSVALELLTEPDVIFLDEPTSGLDPAYERSLMELLRSLADGGHTVAVVTHSLSSLYLCDQVVFLGTGGWVGFVGDADDAPAHFGTQDFPGLFSALESTPPPPIGPPIVPSPPPEESRTAPVDLAHRNSFPHELRVQVLRQWAVLRADFRGLVALGLTPLIPAGLIALMVGGGALEDGSSSVADGRMLLGAIAVTVCVIGAANGVREIVKELPIYLRERSFGLRKLSYLVSKFAFRGAVTAAQSLVVVVVATVRAGGSFWGNALPARLEIWVAVTAGGLATLALGLLISSVVSSSEKAMASVPVLFVLLWLFSGSTMDLSEKPVLREMAYLSPSNWAMSATASTSRTFQLEGCDAATAVDGSTGTPPIACDARWRHGVLQWTFNMVVLAVFPAALLALAEVALARKEPVPELRGDHAIGKATEGLARRLRPSP